MVASKAASRKKRNCGMLMNCGTIKRAVMGSVEGSRLARLSGKLRYERMQGIGNPLCRMMRQSRENGRRAGPAERCRLGLAGRVADCVRCARARALRCLAVTIGMNARAPEAHAAEAQGIGTWLTANTP